MTWFPPGVDFPGSRTYSFATPFFTAPASPTDLLVVKGPTGGKKLYFLELYAVRISVTADTSIPQCFLIKRSADDTGAGNVITAVPHETGDLAGTFGIRYFTTNPSALGTPIGTMFSEGLSTILPGNGVGTSPTAKTLLYFANPNGKPIKLLSATEILAVNFNGVSFNSGTPIIAFGGTVMEID